MAFALASEHIGKNGRQCRLGLREFIQPRDPRRRGHVDRLVQERGETRKLSRAQVFDRYG